MFYYSWYWGVSRGGSESVELVAWSPAESQNHGKLWVGRDLKNHLLPPSLDTFHGARLLTMDLVPAQVLLVVRGVEAAEGTWFGRWMLRCWFACLDEEAMEEGSLPGTHGGAAQSGELWCPWPWFSCWESSGKVFFPAPWRLEMSFQAFMEQNCQLMAPSHPTAREAPYTSKWTSNSSTFSTFEVNWLNLNVNGRIYINRILFFF